MATVKTFYTVLTYQSPEVIDWQRAHDVYFSSGSMKDRSAIRKFGKEKDANYANRKDNVTPDDTYDTEVNSQIEKVFTGGRVSRPTLLEDNENYNQDIRDIALDITKGGMNVNHFMEMNAKLAKVMGTTLIITDNVKSEDIPASAADMTRNELPSAQIYTPLDLCVYGKDEHGKLVYLKMPIIDRDVNADIGAAANNITNPKYRVWRRNRGRIEIYDTTNNSHPDLRKTKASDTDDGKETAINRNLKEWPIVECQFNVPEIRWKFANSKDRKVHSIEELNLNIQSWLNEILKNNTFPIWTENAEPGKSGVKKTTGTNVGVVYGKDMERPGWVTPPSDAAEIIMSAIMDKRQQILKNMSSMSAVDDGASADTRKMADERRIEMNERVATYSEIWEMILMNIAIKAFYDEDYKYIVEYNTKFASMTGDIILAETSEAIRLARESGYSPAVAAHLFTKAMEKLHPSDDDLQELLETEFTNMQRNNDNDQDRNGNNLDDGMLDEDQTGNQQGDTGE